MKRFGPVVFLVLAHGCAERGDIRAFQLLHYPGVTVAQTYLRVDGVERPLVVDKSMSNKAAVAAWESLKWTVIYPNAEGNILAYGYWTSRGRFVLTHWYLPPPFVVREVKDETELPHEFIESIVTELRPEHFDIPVPADPVRFNRPWSR